MKKLFLHIAIILVVVYSFIILNPNIHYYFWGDETQQIIPFTLSFYQSIKNGTISFWNPYVSYGSSNAVHLLTVLGSPSFWGFLLLPSISMIFKWMPIPDMIRFLLIAYFSYQWLSNIVKSEKARLVGTIVMTFSSWAMMWIHYYYYSDSWLYITVLLWTMEEMLQGRKKWFFPIIIALLCVLFLYSAYIASWMILFYLTCRLYMIHGHLSMKELIKHLWPFFWRYLLGIGLAGIIFVPDVYTILNSNRVSVGLPQLISDPKNLFGSFGQLYRNFGSLFSPVINDYDYVIYHSPFLFNDKEHYALYIYSFIIYPLLLPQLKVVSFQGKKPLLITLLFFVVVSISPFSSILFGGTLTQRWSYFFVILHVLILVHLLENHTQFNLKLLKFSCAGVWGILFVLSSLAILGNLTHRANKIMIVVIVPILALLALGYTFTFLNKKQSSKVLSICLILESILCLSVRFVNGEGIVLGQKEPAEIYEKDITDRTYINWIEKRDSGYYRILNDESTAENYNLPLAKVYPSVSYYYGIYNPSIDAYNEDRITGDWFIPYLPSKFMSQSVYGCKYLIANYEWSYIPYGFTQIYEDSNKGVRIYENALDVGLGYAHAKTYSEAYSNTLPKSLQEFMMLKGILTKDSTNEWKEEEPFKKLLTQEMEEYVLKDNHIEINNKEKGILFIDYSKELPASACEYKLMKEDEVVDEWNFEEYGYRAMSIDANSSLDLDCHNAFYNPQVVPATIYYISESDMDSIYQDLQAQDQLELIENKTSSIKAHITIHEEEKMVTTTIPYDKGWKVYVNGNQIEPEFVNLSFLGFPLEEGEYEIEFRFIPRGLNLGILVSVISFVLYILTVRKKKSAH